MTRPPRRRRSDVVLGWILLAVAIGLNIHWHGQQIAHTLRTSAQMIAIGAVVVPVGTLIFLFIVLSIPRARGGR